MQKTYTVSEDNLFDDGADTFRLTLNDVILLCKLVLRLMTQVNQILYTV